VIRLRDVFSNIRVGIQLPLGFSSGLPLLLTGSTLGTWLATVGISLKAIGVLSLVGLSYSWKFVWAPLLDRYPVPLLGRRRGWMLVFQLLLVTVIAALGTMDPKAHLGALAGLALAVAFCAASQDIVIDAYRTDLLPTDERAAGMAVFQVGYRLGMLTAGALGLVLVKHLGWRQVYFLMAACMLVGVVATIFAPEPSEVRAHPKRLVDAVVRPFADLIDRPRGILILLFVVLYRFGNGLASNMTSPFLIQIGFSTTEIGAIQKGVGLIAILAGGVAAGFLVARMRVFNAMLIFGATQAAVHLLFALLAVVGKNEALLAAIVAADNFFVGLATMAFDAYLMSLCNPAFSATQFAFLASLASVGMRVFGASSGFLATKLGWPGFFTATCAMAIPGLLLVLLVLPREAPPSPDAPATS
jgi:PAT family beta-lactamase induction signal transducer AmpG